ncbi:conserved protein of unknown function [Pseudorhizobium banfieldiae]|uniref:Uncharacterized protein n=1 Tax=Pseudorhizobium banfieldiae TaxID=1125847 RepID=L0NDH7_9HYPH|nr:hypothetical protein [Pseudorhizobium banfieldiae]CAD6606146.1 antitoxin [arsenite-oxidising bacterium NT-25]CCF19143.1 conserved protein of unknown function [Pseudorhizobium banfieldiae]
MNAARAALTRAVNRAIAGGAPVYVNQPALALVPEMGDVEDEQTEFSFDGLSDRAKEKARDDYRATGIDYDWWDSIYEDADTIAAMMGIQIKRKHHTLASGAIISGPQIWFSGFSCQGDGACFEGNWYPVKDPIGSLTAVMEHAPLDTKLHEIALDLADFSERCLGLIPDLSVHVEHSGSYYHSGCTRIEVYRDDDDRDFSGLQAMVWRAMLVKHRLLRLEFESEVKATLRAFMDWIYEQLRQEDEYLMSNEAVDEALADYTFDEEGEIVG